MTLIFSAFAEKTDEHTNEKPASIKVLVLQNSEGALIEIKEGFSIFDLKTGKTLYTSSSEKRHFLFPQKMGMKWGNSFDHTYQLRIVPKDPATTFLVNGTEFFGSLEVHYIDDILYFINDTDIELYIKSRLASRFADEMISFPALEALAITERTKAYFLATKNMDCLWHVDGIEENYFGTVMTKLSSEIDLSVDATKYVIMTYKGGAFPAEVTKNSAGRTASYKGIYRKEASSPEGVESPIARKNRMASSWGFKMHRDDLANLMQIDQITGIDLFVDNASSRVYALRVKGKNQTKDISLLALQKKLGEDQLKSNDFTITLEQNTILFEGYGEGLGAGLCLFSANYLARNGEKATQILSDFFPLTHLAQMKGLTEFNLHTLK
ncbi:MAG: hypothetical protein K9M13_04315 [Simkaniaceae bacterium]|nr:hypothetical protein [Simkaniaceae bacterium]